MTPTETTSVAAPPRPATRITLDVERIRKDFPALAQTVEAALAIARHTAVDECAGLPEPEFESYGDSFRTVFRKTAPVEQRFPGLALNERPGAAALTGGALVVAALVANTLADLVPRRARVCGKILA